MHQTTIRFASDTWARIEAQARANGVSSAQYVREATLEKLALADGIARSGAEMGQEVDLDPRDPYARGFRAARAKAAGARESSEAVWAQAQLARRRAQEMRQVAQALTTAVKAGRA